MHGTTIQLVVRQAELGNAALPVDTVIESVRYGGVVSTGAHGTARDFGAVPDFVESLTVVDGRGQPVVYNASSPFFAQVVVYFLRIARTPPRPSACFQHSLRYMGGALRLSVSLSKAVMLPSAGAHSTWADGHHY